MFGGETVAGHLQDAEMKILKEIAEALNEGTDVKKVLQDVLKKLLQVTGFSTGWIFLIKEQDYQLIAYENLPPALSYQNKQPMCSGDCWCVDRFMNGRLEKATNIIECKRIEDAIAEKLGDTQGITHHATVPLRAGNERFGILNVGSPNKKLFQQEELALLEAIAFQIGTAIKRIFLTEKEQEMALNAERNRLARDLHDSVNQLLFSLNLTARGGMEMTNDPEIKETFGYIQELAQDALSEMKALIWQLKPKGLENGIISALSDYSQMLGLHLKTELKGIVSLPSKIEEALWRIGQESLANCKKHSQQEEVSLSVIVQDSLVTMIISDQGCGFHYEEHAEIPSLGLKSMKKRTEALGGTFELKSKQGEGTFIQVTLPI